MLTWFLAWVFGRNLIQRIHARWFRLAPLIALSLLD